MNRSNKSQRISVLGEIVSIFALVGLLFGTIRLQSWYAFRNPETIASVARPAAFWVLVPLFADMIVLGFVWEHWAKRPAKPNRRQAKKPHYTKTKKIRCPKRFNAICLVIVLTMNVVICTLAFFPRIELSRSGEITVYNALDHGESAARRSQYDGCEVTIIHESSGRYIRERYYLSLAIDADGEKYVFSEDDFRDLDTMLGFINSIEPSKLTGSGAENLKTYLEIAELTPEQTEQIIALISYDHHAVQ